MIKCPHNNWVYWKSLPNRCADCNCSAVAIHNSDSQEIRKLRAALKEAQENVKPHLEVYGKLINAHMVWTDNPQSKDHATHKARIEHIEKLEDDFSWESET